jgi:hypothetical protein
VGDEDIPWPHLRNHGAVVHQAHAAGGHSWRRTPPLDCSGEAPAWAMSYYQGLKRAGSDIVLVRFHR